jgi:hypothetical protein
LAIDPATAQLDVTLRTLMSLMCVGGASATPGTIVNLFDAIRLREVEMWCANTNSLTGIALTWSGNSSFGMFNTNDVVVSDTSMSNDNPAHIRTRPPAKSLLSDWWQGKNANANTAFLDGKIFHTLFTGAHTIIVDITLDIVLADSEQFGFALSSSPTSSGAIYYAYLDFGATSPAFTPVGVTEFVLK